MGEENYAFLCKHHERWDLVMINEEDRKELVGLRLENGIEAQTHNGVRQMLGLHFVRTGKLPTRLSNYYSNLFAKRHSGDYDVFIYFDRDTVETIYPQAEEFIEAIESLI